MGTNRTLTTARFVATILALSCAPLSVVTNRSMAQEVPPASPLTVADPSQIGFEPARLEAARTVLDNSRGASTTPGGVAIVLRKGQVVLHHAFGHLAWDDESAHVTTDTLYDLASLTKVIVTTTLVMQEIDAGRLGLDDPVAKFIPCFGTAARRAITIRDLLTHSSGLPCCGRNYVDMAPFPLRRPWLAFEGAICVSELEAPRHERTIYSDLGFILLGRILQKTSGISIDQLAEERIFAPLGMTSTVYRPRERLPQRTFAPTEQDPWRGRLVAGEVHDENTYLLGGISSHAGLFGTAADVARFGQAMLGGGQLGGVRFVSEETVEEFTKRADVVEGSSRALGWDTPSGRSSAGRYFSAKSFGHTGFTGTSLWIDPEMEIVAVLLTNRVHPTRENIAIRQLRPRFHDAVMEALRDPPPPR